MTPQRMEDFKQGAAMIGCVVDAIKPMLGEDVWQYRRRILKAIRLSIENPKECTDAFKRAFPGELKDRNQS